MDATIEVFFWRSLTEEGSPGEVRNTRKRNLGPQSNDRLWWQQEVSNTENTQHKKAAGQTAPEIFYSGCWIYWL